MKKLTTVLIAACGLIVLVGAESRQALHFPLHAFSIEPLEGRTAGGTAVLMTMSLPPSGGFASNVNVLTQNAGGGSIDDYLAVSKRGFEQAGMKVIKADKLDDSTLLIEYNGIFQGTPMHWYAKASLKGNEVLLATGTATEKQWPKDAARLKACVDSFKRD